MRSLVYISSILLIGLSACSKKEFPEPVNSEPVFRAEVLIDGATLNLTPGVDGNYMYTSQSELSEGNVVLESGIAPQNCEDCGPAIWFTWTSNTPAGLSEPYDPALHFTNGNYEFNTGVEPVGTQALIEDFDELSNNDAFFLLNGEPMFSATSLLEENPGGMTPISLEYISNGIEPPFISSSLLVANFAGYNPCGFEEHTVSGFFLELLTPQDALVVVPEFLPPNAEVIWNVNGETTGTSLASQPFMIESDMPINSVEALVFNQFAEMIWAYSLELAPLFVGSIEPISLTLQGIPAPEAGDPEVGIRYVAEDGEVFRSFLCGSGNEQPESSYFEVIAQDHFDHNQQGTLTSVVSISTEVVLFSESNPLAEPLVVNIDQADIAFALGE